MALKRETLLTVGENCLLMPFLVSRLPHKSRDNIKSLLRRRQVWIGGESVYRYDHPLRTGQRVIIRWNQVVDPEVFHRLSIVFEDEYLIVIDKQAGVLSVSAGIEHLTAYSLLSRYVKQKNPANRIFVVHRLDRDTSGLMIYAKSEPVQAALQQNWKENVRARTYTALVEGRVIPPEGSVRSYLFESKSFVVHSSQDAGKGDLAVTQYRTLQSNANYTLLEVSLETGKKNQIRVHMQDIGHPVAGDKKYGAVTNPLNRLGLHASTLIFVHPVNHREMSFSSPVPAKFKRVFQI